MSHIISLSVLTRPDEDGNDVFARFSDLAIDLQDQHAQVTVHSIDMDEDLEVVDEIEEFHDENTLQKVLKALRLGITKHCDGDGFISDNQINGVLTELQNAGILFREIKK